MENFMTSEEIAELLHIDPATVRRLVNKSELSAYRIGSDYRFAPSDLAEYLQRQRIPASTSSRPSNPSEQTALALQKFAQEHQFSAKDPRDHFDRFTERARRVLALSQEEAQRFQHNYIGTEHLLLGLIREKEGIASQVLRNMGIELERVRDAVFTIIGRGDRIVLGEIGLTPRAKKVVELAVDEARRLAHHYIGTEHILLGLIREGQGIAAGVLESFGLNLENVRAETLRVLEEQEPEQSEQEQTADIPSIPSDAAGLVAEGQAGLDCTTCGARSPEYFRYCFNCGKPLSQ